MSAIKYWVWLNALKGLGCVKIARLLDFFGTPENIYTAQDAELKEAARLSERDLAELKNKSFDRANSILEQCDRLKIKIITMADAQFPDRLKAVHAAPALLYVKGRMMDFDEEIVLCMVGSRKATPYGLVNAERLAYSLSKSGAVILSGMASGIDTAAHKGALKAGRPTTAVLGCGLDICYPPENRGLMEDIAATGTLISEYPPGMQALAGNFPARNRILSGLSLGTIVVEAAATSGALITANYALEQGRDVFAVPGNIDAESCRGTNSLIQQGAKLITEASDVLEEYSGLYPHKLIGTKEYKIPEAAQSTPVYETKCEVGLPEGLNATEAAIFGAVADEKTVHIDRIIQKTGLSAPEVLSALTILQLKNIIKQLPGKYFSLDQR
ncbi:MAG: DNA-processing protein DprA [Bacillota bacterium]|nr:DNA-processing protein DprA [Bacillota bacterium]